MKNTTYDQYVKMGKDLVNQIGCYQAQIAYYATQVCTIKHGGITKDTTYTLTKYAKDIGVKSKTLSEWVSVYKNVITKLNMDPEKVTKKDWSVANKVQNMFNEEKRIEQAMLGISGSKNKGVRKNMSPEIVKDLFNQNYNKNSFQSEIYEWDKYVIFIKNKLTARDLNEASVSSLINLKENLDKASEVLLRHISNPKKSTKKVVNKTAQNRVTTK